MARSRGPRVFFKRIRLGAAKAQPYLKPGLKVGQRALLTALKSSIATLKTINPRVIRSRLAAAARIGAFATQDAAVKLAPKKDGGLRLSKILEEAFQLINNWRIPR